MLVSGYSISKITNNINYSSTLTYLSALKMLHNKAAIRIHVYFIT